ncbi:hypothetical protein MEQU1_001000 [Malassezia equina]|uniref:Uncharacterized protein n=1 Tax=Malassezia equina TaxID=1381935 RepID=A0AAF0J2T9_9BASI|nr:hypothetical protein MEQU1_001000 [Malassezia equina]
MAEAARSELDEAILDVQRRLDQAHDPAKLEALLRDSVEQHRLLLNELTAELELEKRDCEDHKESLRELQQISHALTKPLEPLASNAAPSELLRMMVRVTEGVFTEKRLCVQLRFLLEHLLNALWDTPSHPYAYIV